MSTQSTLKDFFQTKLNHLNRMDNRKKKFNLSLNKTPTKTPKLCSDKSVSFVINLDSDDENYLNEPFGETASPDGTKSALTKTPKLCSDKSVSIVINLDSDDENYLSKPFGETASPDGTKSDASNSTIIYSPETPIKNTLLERSNFETPNKLLQSHAKIKTSLSPQSNIDTPDTSLLSQQSNTESIINRSSSTPSKTGTPKRKFYSPTKKRCSTIKTPTKARKNIFHSLDETTKYDKSFIQNGQGLDDKTTFMLDIIENFLQDKSLINLLNESSCNLLKKVVSESNVGLKLLCNLYRRKERWFRWDEVKGVIAKMKQQEVDDTSCRLTLNSLIQKGVIVASNYEDHKQVNLSFDEYADILKREEILAVCKLYKLKSSGKQDGINLLRGYSKQKSNISAYLVGTTTTSNEIRVMRSLAEKLGACFKLSEEMRRTLDELYVLMYLGMDYTIIKEKKLELTLINDKANFQTFPYKNVKTDNAGVVFKSRQEFERYLHAMSIYDKYLCEPDKIGNTQRDLVRRVYDMYKAISDEEMQSYSAKPAWLYKFTPPNIFIKILEDGIKYLKQDKSEESVSLALEILSALTAQTTFRQHKKPEWYAEKALIVDKLGWKPEEAASILLEGLKLDVQEEAKDVVRRRAGLLARRQRHGVSAGTRAALLAHLEGEEGLERSFPAEHVYKCPMESNGGKIKFESRTESGVVVQGAEEFCLTYYVQSGRYTHGGHWEGRIVTTIFFLLFWDEIYAPLPEVPGLALCQFQQYPLDMWGKEFQRNRSQLLFQRLAQVELGNMRDLLRDMRRVWDQRPEGELSGINRSISWEQVSGVSVCLGPGPLAAICRRLATHYGYSHSGFPDLTLWNVQTNEIAFVEVKTDSDRPSTKQLQWMQYLRQHGVHVEFCYVGVHTTRCRARGGERLQEVKSERVQEVESERQQKVKSKRLQKVESERQQEVKSKRLQEVKSKRLQEVKSERQQEVKSERQQEVKSERQQEVKSEQLQEVKSEQLQEVKSERLQEVKSERLQEMKSERLQDVKSERQQEVKRKRLQEVKTERQQEA